MKRKKIILFVLAVFLCMLCGRCQQQSEYWLRTEENGIVHQLAYIHEYAASHPRKAQDYVGKPISFTAPLLCAQDNVRLEYYGRIQRLIRLSAFDGREFLVQSGAAAELDYAKGTTLYVSGKITELGPKCVMLLDVPGTPGWPNNIMIEEVK